MMEIYYVQEFARLAGVTVRTLHYYDQAGLLKPQRRQRVRLYQRGDLLRLQQILTLKYMGFSLDEIRALLDSPTYDVRESLRIQKEAINHHIEQLQEVSQALELTVAHLDAAETLDWAQIGAIIKAVTGSDKQEWVRRYFTDEQLASIYARDVSPEEVRDGTEAWMNLIAAYREKRHLPPDHPDVQALAAEQIRLVNAFTKGDPEIEESLKAMYSDIDHIPAEYRPYDNDLFYFMQEACRIYKACNDEV